MKLSSKMTRLDKRIKKRKNQQTLTTLTLFKSMSQCYKTPIYVQKFDSDKKIKQSKRFLGTTELSLKVSN